MWFLQNILHKITIDLHRDVSKLQSYLFLFWHHFICKIQHYRAKFIKFTLDIAIKSTKKPVVLDIIKRSHLIKHRLKRIQINHFDNEALLNTQITNWPIKTYRLDTGAGISSSGQCWRLPNESWRDCYRCRPPCGTWRIWPSGSSAPPSCYRRCCSNDPGTVIVQSFQVWPKWTCSCDRKRNQGWWRRLQDWLINWLID